MSASIRTSLRHAPSTTSPDDLDQAVRRLERRLYAERRGIVVYLDQQPAMFRMHLQREAIERGLA